MADDVTLGELGRRINDVGGDVKELRKEVVGRREYEESQRGTNLRLTTVEAKVIALEADVETERKERAAARAQRGMQVALMIAGPIVATVVAFIVGGGLIR
ncbi:hypothetical protein [Litorihabitans aurantiacus]|uniref:Uncharacterized protein n=1 Tax=Litorihabitans aurantiacus TaxID=1930061 RepID=A0AA38CXP0_9MICO|nr:hypothetical protein [Litorihabitans aurantiacus]GMA33498.1 hypothetical protein GCM10025875_34900 [Litorihabitans aurantiacus]GMA33597.1 hypothetical protein GCM10025875_35890 [Litorihabitans aurantiacus]